MRVLIFLFFGFVMFEGLSQTKEVVKIDVNSGCKSYIKKRTYINEIYSKAIKVVNGVYFKGHLGFAYREHIAFSPNGEMIYFHMDEDFVKYYESSTIRITIDNIDFELDNALDVQTFSSMNIWMEDVKTYSMGYKLEATLASAIQSASSISISLLKASTHVRKEWRLSKSLVSEIRDSYTCFVDHFTPIEEEFEHIRFKRNEEIRIAKEKEERLAEKERLRIERERMIALKEEQRQQRLKKLQILKSDSLHELEYRSRLMGFQKGYDSLGRILENKYRIAKKNGGVLITNFDVVTSEYDVTNVNFTLYNCSGRRIKYVLFNVRAYNAVDDPIGGLESLKGIGYVEIDKKSSWGFERVWYSGTLEYVRIISIKLTYEDGSTRLVNDLSNMIIDEGNSLNSLIGSSRYTCTEHGSVGLCEYENDSPKIFAFMFPSINKYGSIEASVFSDDDLPTHIKSLEKVIEASRNNQELISGIFKAYNYSTNIYICTDEGENLMTVKNAEKLLTKLKSFVQ